MKIKSLIVTVLVLAALSIAVFIARRPAPPAAADARINQSLVDSAAIDKAAKLRLSDAGKTVDLVRQADGTWRVPSYYDLPADFSKLSGFVANLTEAKIQRLVTSAPDRIARLEFKDTKIELLDAADKPVFSATLGKNAEVGGGRYVKFGAEAKAYLVNLSAFLDTEAKNWANAELLNLKADDIARIEIPFAEGGPIVVSRAKKEDPWTADKTPAGQRVKADKVATVLSSVGNIRFSDSTAPDDANAVVAKANLRSFKVTTFDNKSVTVALGRKPEEKKLKALAPAADGKTGPGALGSVADLTKKEEPAKDGKPADAKPLAPEFETIPAGPVFAFVAHSDAAAPVNAAMQKRAYQISDYTFTGLPQKADELFEPVPAAAPAPADKAKTEDKKTDSTK
ncbi:DUF4340 domain-containing protein [Horticoccus sp. 23ND18S-11]|uniref:DUF4340 domain-containing protein n=1 Tax=Horticoccus sp. 23ND18S-11 TaxID=3391832 RepID=UPI0039C9BDF9